MVKIKICGLTSIADALQAAEFGADALGLNFFKDSPRHVTREKAAEIVRELPPFIEPVAVYVDQSINQFIKTELAELGLRTFQLHRGKPLPGDFNLNDFRGKFVQMSQMGGMAEMMKMMPVVGDVVPDGDDPDPAMHRIAAMIDAMTDEERQEPNLISLARRREIAEASGVEPDDVKRFLVQFEEVRILMRQMATMSMWQKFKMITSLGKAGAFEPKSKLDSSIFPAKVKPLRMIPAFPIRDKQSLQSITSYLETCSYQGLQPAAILVDAHVPGSHGGTGQTLPWEVLADFSPGVPLILAGGLTPDNVARAIRLVRPYAVDVASGVECSPGNKDADKMKRFIDVVKSQ